MVLCGRVLKGSFFPSCGGTETGFVSIILLIINSKNPDLGLSFSQLQRAGGLGERGTTLVGQKGHPCGPVGQDQRGLFSNLKARALLGWIWDLCETCDPFLLTNFSFGGRNVCFRPAQEEVATVLSGYSRFVAAEQFYPWRDTPQITFMLGLGEILYLKLRMSQFCGELV